MPHRVVDSPDVEHRRNDPAAIGIDEHRLVARLTSPGAIGTLAFQVGHGVMPSGSWFQTVLALDGRRPIVIAEVDIATPATGWELRASGLWADHNCETPLEHWSYGLEAFALAIDDHAELVGRGFGDRTPLGWELDFEATEPAYAEGPHAYGQAGTLHGLVLLAEGELEVEGPAVRSHRWGDGRHVAAVASPAGGDRPEGHVALPGPDGVWWAPTRP